jgi:hypothetical protein
MAVPANARFRSSRTMPRCCGLARQRMREEILSSTTAELRNFADALAYVAAHGRVVVFGSEQTIAVANAERPGLLSASRVM